MGHKCFAKDKTCSSALGELGEPEARDNLYWSHTVEVNRTLKRKHCIVGLHSDGRNDDIEYFYQYWDHDY